MTDDFMRSQQEQLAPGECDLSCKFDRFAGFLKEQWDDAVYAVEDLGNDLEQVADDLGNAVSAANPLEVPRRVAEGINERLQQFER